VALYIYRVGRSCPARKSFYKSKSIRTPLFGSDTGAPVRLVRSTTQTGTLDVQILYKSYLPHPDSDLDVPHMNLDLLDESYPMVKSKLYFVDFDHTGLTGGTHRSDRCGTHRSDRSDKMCQFWVRTYAPLFSGKACVPEKIHKDQNWLKTMINNASPIFFS
jgi:hypothetical protein